MLGRLVTSHLFQRTESAVTLLEQLEQIVTECKEDYLKSKGGNKAAGTRIRKAMQDVKNLAQEIRKEMLETRTDE